MGNPFTPMFGTIPNVMVGRDDIVRDMQSVFDNPFGNPNSATLLVGARGTGKTALLGKISQEAGLAGWISVDVFASNGMLDDILVRLGRATRHILPSGSHRKIKAFEVARVGSITLEDSPQEAGNWRSSFEDYAIALEEKDSGILVTIDEADPGSDELTKIVSIFQHYFREGRKVALVLAGLPANVDALVNGKNTSFLRRARRRELGSLSDMQTREALKSTIVAAGRDIDSAALDRAIEIIQGFPYMLQLLGYEMWIESTGQDCISLEHVNKAATRAMPELEENVYGATLRELTDRDRDFLRCMFVDGGESRMTDIASRMGVSSSYANNYKRKLMRQGVLEQVSRSTVKVSMPQFLEYLQRTIG